MKLQSKLQFWVNSLQSSIGYIPSILAVSAVLLSHVLVWIDRNFVEQIEQNAPWLFGGSADAARGLLSTIAASLITVVSISFSIIIIALQQAANNYSPRVLRTFTSDKGNQIVLGMYLATFTYSLLVLRTIRSETTNGGFIPAISIVVAILLTLVCLGLLIYFINKMISSLQAAEIIKRIHTELEKEADQQYPDRLADDDKDSEEASVIMKRLKKSEDQLIVRSEKAGFVNLLNEDMLAQITAKRVKWIYIPVQVGDFVNHDDVLAVIDNVNADKEIEKIIKQSIEIHGVRSMHKAPLFGVRLLVDIALRAISPGINDPTTAAYAIRYMGDNLKSIAKRKFPESDRTFDKNPIRFIIKSPRWDEYVNLAFTQLRREAINEAHVLQVLIKVLRTVGQACPIPSRKSVVLKELSEMREIVTSGNFTKSDRSELLRIILQAQDDIR